MLPRVCILVGRQKVCIIEAAVTKRIGQQRKRHVRKLGGRGDCARCDGECCREIFRLLFLVILEHNN